MSKDKSLKLGYEDKASTYFEAERSDMLKYIPQNSTLILEVGCGYGGFGKLLREQYSTEVWGVEIEEKAASLAAQNLNKVICAPFTQELDLPRNSFDCIIFNDVLEHLVDPFSALSLCKDLLSEKGIVVASIPNVRYFGHFWQYFVHANWEYTDDGILDKTHLRFFTRKSIISTFERLGYSIISIEGLNPFTDRYLLKRFKILSIFLGNKVEDMRYLQFAVVASPIKK